VGDLGARDDVGFPDRLERIDPVGVLLAYLHHLAKTALANNLEKLEVLDLELVALVLNVFDANLELAGAILHVNPINTTEARSTLAGCMLSCSLFPFLFAHLGVLDEGLSLLEPRVDANKADEDVLATTRARRGIGIPDVKVNHQLSRS